MTVEKKTNTNKPDEKIVKNGGEQVVNEPGRATDAANVVTPPGQKGDNVQGLSKSGLNKDKAPETRTLGLPDTYLRPKDPETKVLQGEDTN